MEQTLAIKIERLQGQLTELGAVNRAPDGSCRRVALTDADAMGRDLVRSWMRDLGLTIHIDRIGNVIGIRGGQSEGRPVMTGSHVDTVATGGLYDGAYGVLAGLEAIRVLNEVGLKTQRPLAVAFFTNEEGVRFQPDMMGSLVYAGGLSVEEALATKAEDGSVLRDELSRIGYAGTMPCGEIQPHAYVELHIEQGPVLHTAGEALAAVDFLQGISWQKVTITGVSNHAGTTPMRLRHDAGYCAGQIAAFVRALATRMGGAQVGTVGSIQLQPNLVNVIARKAIVTIDLRNTNDGLLAEAEREVRVFLADLARTEGVTIESVRTAQSPSVAFDVHIIETIERSAKRLGYKSIRRMTSGAGHDAQMLARICPTAMIFVPSVDGVSHNPREFTEPVHLAIGANVLLQTLVELANE
jgi:beta-ureidopropionase / N-carbamoyl-L-amino-acid hydrolase